MAAHCSNLLADQNLITGQGAVHMSPVNRASSGHEILSSAAKEDLNLR